MPGDMPYCGNCKLCHNFGSLASSLVVDKLLHYKVGDWTFDIHISFKFHPPHCLVICSELFSRIFSMPDLSSLGQF